MRLRFLDLRTLILQALCTGCDILSPGDCVAIGRFALNVTVEDSITGSTPQVATRVIARDGTYADTLILLAPDPTFRAFALAPERPGSYFVTVEAEGYRLWSRANILVERSTGKCHELQGVTIRARIQR